MRRTVIFEQQFFLVFNAQTPYSIHYFTVDIFYKSLNLLLSTIFVFSCHLNQRRQKQGFSWESILKKIQSSVMRVSTEAASLDITPGTTSRFFLNRSIHAVLHQNSPPLRNSSACNFNMYLVIGMFQARFWRNHLKSI